MEPVNADEMTMREGRGGLAIPPTPYRKFVLASNRGCAL